MIEKAGTTRWWCPCLWNLPVVMRLGSPMPWFISHLARAGRVTMAATSRALVPGPWILYDACRVPAEIPSDFAF